MAKKKTSARPAFPPTKIGEKVVLPKLKARHAIDPVIRERLEQERAQSWTEQRDGYISIGFIKGLEWTLHQLEALREK